MPNFYLSVRCFFHLFCVHVQSTTFKEWNEWPELTWMKDVISVLCDRLLTRARLATSTESFTITTGVAGSCPRSRPLQLWIKTPICRRFLRTRRTTSRETMLKIRWERVRQTDRETQTCRRVTISSTLVWCTRGLRIKTYTKEFFPGETISNNRSLSRIPLLWSKFQTFYKVRPTSKPVTGRINNSTLKITRLRIRGIHSPPMTDELPLKLFQRPLMQLETSLASIITRLSTKPDR